LSKLTAIVHFGGEKLEATASGLTFVRRIISPHTGQSSQLFPDANGGGAEFLPTVARSALKSTSHAASRALRINAKDSSMQP
jgi:hypothetical protein